MTSGGRGRSKTHQASTPLPLPPWKLINQSSSLIPSTVEVAMQYRKFLVNGLKVGHADTDFLLRTKVLMPEEEKLVFVFQTLARGRQRRQQRGLGLY